MNPYAEPLAWALVHFVWQGAALALAAFLAIRWLRPSARTRYATGVVALAAMLAAPIVTFALLARTVDESPALQAPASQLAEPPATSGERAASSTASPASPASLSTTPVLVLAIWLTGVAVFSLRLLGGWVVARRMVTRAVRPVAPDIAVLARRVAGRLALDRVVRIVESSAVSVPVMVGWLKPVVLLPAAALTGLTPTQLEALLAHELAHVRRHDYLVNLLQSAVETLLFYHPAVWWMSKLVRAEREHCCDDLVVGVCDRLVYVSALTDLAAFSLPRPALAATDGSLVARVRRILGRTDAGTTTGGGWVSVLVALFVVGVIAPMTMSQMAASEQGRQGVVTGVPSGVASGVPGGVVGGVREGVAGGVPGGVAVIDEQGTVSVEEAHQRERAARLQEAAEALRQFSHERSNLERRKIEENARAQMAAAKAELDAMRKQYERSKQLVEVGVLNPREVVELEQKMFQAEQRIVRAQRELEVRMAELALNEREQVAQQSYQATVREYEKALQAADARRAFGSQETRRPVDEQDRVAQLERQLRELRQAVEQMLATVPEMQRDRTERMRAEVFEVLRGRGLAAEPSRVVQLLAQTAPVAGPSETIRAGDVLSVDITGEPDLPRAYAVQSDGTIRLPLIGSIKVVGLTAQQAGQVITKQIARVNSAASVQVSLRRPKVEERRSPLPAIINSPIRGGGW